MDMRLEALKQAVAENPNDAVALAILADYLQDECNQPDEARVYRLAVLVAKLDFRWGLPDVALERFLELPAGTLVAAGLYTGSAVDYPRHAVNPVVHARLVLAWMFQFAAAIDKAAERLRREAKWLEQAREGNVQALLANPETRKSLRCLAYDDTHGRYKPITSFTAKRKAIAQAKQVMVERKERRANCHLYKAAVNPHPGKYRQKYLSKLRDKAVAIGKRYHETHAPLYQSKRGEVVYGRGGQVGYDGDAYSKAYNWRYGGASWKNAGARLDTEDGTPTCVIVENWRGTEIARVPLAPHGE